MTESTHIKQFKLMAQYNTWMNNQIYELVASLTEEERRRNLGAFFDSLHGTLNHILLADRTWLARFATNTCYQFKSLQDAKLIFDVESLGKELYSDFKELRNERAQTDNVIENWTSELSDEILSASMKYHNVSRTVEREHSLWFALTHFFNHQTHHRAQVTTLLHQLGYDYGVTDFIYMYNVAKDLV